MEVGHDQPVLTCRDLRKAYGERVAVAGVSFDIAAGEIYGLLGPNGAGKTTTISMICGLLSRDAGDVTVAGRPLGPDSTAAKADLGLVPQEIALYSDLSCRENLAFFGRLQGLRGAELDQRIDEALGVVGLAERAGERVDSYSGGMKRRANIAVGLLHRPRLLVLDEPTVGVDPQSRNTILESIEALGAEGLSVLYTTHYMEEAERLCDRVGIIDEGRIVAEGSRRELVAQIGEGERIEVTGVGDLDTLAERCRQLAGVVAADRIGDRVAITVTQARAALASVVETADDAGIDIAGIDIVEPDLEAVFLRLTGKALRD